jgi:NodT family efflux transporter outer membrane factor (OMF) lipoprotein
MRSKLGGLAWAMLLAGCAPKLVAPDMAVKVDRYVPGQNVAAVPMPAAWWGIFGNQALDRLVQTGLAANPSIGEAAANLTAADETAASANAGFLPQIIIGGPSYPLVQRSSYPTGPNGYPPYTVYALTGTISYDPGLFGARKYTFENGAALAAYNAAELDAARQSVAGNIAAAAITLAGVEAQIAATRQIIAAEQRLLTLLQGEYTDGAIAQLDVLQQQSALLAAEASLPPLQDQVDVARDKLAILTGRLPADFVVPEITLTSLDVPEHIPLEVPSEYLADRPDLRAARAQVVAQNAALGVAVAHLYPDFSLSAQGGYAAETVGSLIEPESALWTLAGNMLAPIYEGGALHEKKAAAQAQLASALMAYRQAVLTAFGQAADALQAVQTDEAELHDAQDAAHTADAAFQLASAQFSLGAVDYTTVLTAQQAAAHEALAEVQARTALLLDVAVLQAAMAA